MAKYNINVPSYVYIVPIDKSKSPNLIRTYSEDIEITEFSREAAPRYSNYKIEILGNPPDDGYAFVSVTDIPEIVTNP